MKRKIMEGKLVKTGNDYILYSKDNSVLGITSGTMEGRMLSIKNCQAIENGYDLDVLASERLSTRFNENSGYHKFVYVDAYKEGFQKALEILGDKKFSKDDMIRASDWYIDTKGKKLIDELIESLQQTEWDVEIETILIQSSIEGEPIWKPKLDSDGCLILTKI